MTEPVPCPAAPKPLNYILVKPVGSRCNLSCAYCFYHDRGPADVSAPKIMEYQVLEEIIRRCLSGPDRQVSFGWQGGEPTLAGLDFYRGVIDLQKKYGRGKRIGNALQTNGLLLNRDWIDFLTRYRFLIGLSIDGPEEIHDTYRRFPNGSGSARHVRRALEGLLKAGAAVNTMTVVNNVSADYPDILYSYFRDLGVRYMQFMPCVETDPLNPGKAASFSVDSSSYGSFLCQLFDRWTEDFQGVHSSTSIRFFDTVAAAYAGLPVPECTHRSECGDYVLVERNGDVYACDFFVEDDWKLGNVMETPLEELLNSRRQRTFARRKSDLPPECHMCPWTWICRGGCVKDRLRDPADGGSNHFCEAYKTFFEYTEERFQLMVEPFRRD